MEEEVSDNVYRIGYLKYLRYYEAIARSNIDYINPYMILNLYLESVEPNKPHNWKVEGF